MEMFCRGKFVMLCVHLTVEEDKTGAAGVPGVQRESGHLAAVVKCAHSHEAQRCRSRI